jgi:hypothetical protein
MIETTVLRSARLEQGREVRVEPVDRARMESVVTKVFVDNLDVLVSDDGDREKLRRLAAAADLLLEGEPPANPR